MRPDPGSIADIGSASAGTLPPIVNGPESQKFSSALDRLRNDLHTAAAQQGKRRQLRFVEYLSSVSTSVRLSVLGAGSTAFTQSAYLLKNLTMTLIFVTSADVVSGLTLNVGELDEAFTLALAGYAPIERVSDGWIARRLLG